MRAAFDKRGVRRVSLDEKRWFAENGFQRYGSQVEVYWLRSLFGYFYIATRRTGRWFSYAGYYSDGKRRPVWAEAAMYPDAVYERLLSIAAGERE